MGMEHHLGQPGLINWQNRRTRRPTGRMNIWATVTVICAIAGVASLVCQMAGWVHWRGPLALVPAGLLLLAINAQLIAAVRAALSWLAG
jgi:fatty acid desaturase